MSSQRETILGRLDPEAAALLLEVASRPSSLLLSAERVALEDPRGRSPGVLTPQTPGLSRAERQLLSVHRRHLGLLLHELAAGLIWEADRFQDLLLGAHGPRGDQRPAAPATVLAHLQAPLPPALDALNLPPHGHSLTARISSLLQGLTQPHALALDSQIQACLAVANLLTPSVWSKVNQALFLCARGLPRVAESILLKLDVRQVGREGAHAIWEANLANSRLKQGQFTIAARGYHRSYLLSPETALLKGCWISALLGQEWSILEEIANQGWLPSTSGEPKIQRILGMLDQGAPNSGSLSKTTEVAKNANSKIRSHVEAVLHAENQP